MEASAKELAETSPSDVLPEVSTILTDTSTASTPAEVPTKVPLDTSSTDAVGGAGTKDPEEMTSEERSEFAAKCKEIGNRGFKIGDWAYAIVAYEEGIRYLRYAPGEEGAFPSGYDHGGSDRVESDMRLAVLLFNNLAAALLKLGEDRKAVECCSQVLEFDATNTKALFRLGQAQLALGEHDAALEALGRVLKLEPLNHEAAQLKRSVELDSKSAVRKEKAMFAKMLA